MRYKPRNSIKGHELADFVTEFAPSPETLLTICQVTIRPWKLYVDGMSNAWGSRVRIFLESPEGMRLEKSLRLGFKASNNEAEYEALTDGLQATRKLGVDEVEVFSDSRLVINKVDGSFKAQDQCMY